MADFVHQPSMAAGEIGPQLYGRIDLDLYNIGLRTCKNFIVRQHGGATNRPGLVFVAECRNHDRKTRLIPFKFNEQQNYVLEHGHLLQRIIRDGAEVLESPLTITAITAANPAVVTSAGHGLSNGDDVYISGVEGMTEVNGRTFRIANVATDTFELQDYLGNNIDSSAYQAYTGAGTAARIYSLVTPYDEADLFSLNYTQSNDVLTIVNNEYYPRDITRTGHAAWTVSVFDNKMGPFKDINDGPITVYWTNGPSTDITITASTSLFSADMVGELFYIQQNPTDSIPRWEAGDSSVGANAVKRAGPHYYQNMSGAGTSGTYRPDHTEGTASDGKLLWLYLHSGFGVARIKTYVSSTEVVATQVQPYPSTISSLNPSPLWAKQAWSAAEGYPAAVDYHKQRLVFGGTVEQPNGIWLSGIALRTFFGYGNPILDDESISLKLDTGEANGVRHLLTLTTLIAMTSASEHSINGPDNLILATDPPSAPARSYNGVAKVRPITVIDTVLFVQDLGNAVRSLKYNDTTQTFQGIDLTARAPHLFRNKTIVDWSYQKYPFSVIWAVMSDGTLNGFTYMEEQQVYAWHRHQTDGFFESVCCIREGEESVVYFVIRREIDGETKRYIEKFAPRYFKDIRDAFFLDSGLTYDGRNFEYQVDGWDETESPKYKKVDKTSTTITITGGSTWAESDTLTLQSSASLFKAADVGDEIVFRYNNENDIEIALRLRITAYSSSTQVSAIPTKDVPSSHRNAARTDWEFARMSFAPLHHLEGKTCSALADGNVIENLVVEQGKVTLPYHASVAHIGLPYVSRLETLDISQPQGQRKAKTVNIDRLFLTVEETRSIFAGINGFDQLFEYKQRTPDIGYDAAIPAETGLVEIQTNTEWSNKGRIAIQQSLPLPITINCISTEAPVGYS